MKNLILIRHAKSSWDAPLIDHDRPLCNRGINDAHLISEAIKEILPKSNLIWSSTAKRASETAMILAQNIGWPHDQIIFDSKLYTFDGSQLAKNIKNCEDGYENVIVFGHNDAITDFVNTFGCLYVDNVPTCGVVKISFDVKQWALIKKGIVQKTIFPRDIRI